MEATLPSAIDSVLRQTTDDYELLILDDGSNDGTWRYLSKIANERIRTFRFSKKQGLTSARNYLLSVSRGKYLSILDADDYLSPHKLERHAKVLNAMPEVGVVWGRTLVSQLGDPEQHWKLMPPIDFKSGWDLTQDYQASHSATTWRRSVLIELGGYDPSFTEVEAVDLFLKVGDNYQQHFCGAIAAHKEIDPNNDFRVRLANSGGKLSREILQNTLHRRFGIRNPSRLIHR